MTYPSNTTLLTTAAADWNMDCLHLFWIVAAVGRRYASGLPLLCRSLGNRGIHSLLPSRRACISALIAAESATPAIFNLGSKPGRYDHCLFVMGKQGGLCGVSGVGLLSAYRSCGCTLC